MKSWKILAQGPFGPGDLRVVFRDEMKPLSSLVESEISAHWERALAFAEKEGRRLFDGELFHLDDVKGKELQLSPTSYRRWTFAAGREGGVEISRPLASCAAVISADGRLLLQERSGEVAEGAGLLHVPGGHPDPSRDMQGGVPDLFGAMEAELLEELALESGDLDQGQILALIENLENGKPELLFLYHCHLTSEEIAMRSIRGRDAYEYDSLTFIPSKVEKLSAFLLDNKKELAIPSQALLHLLIQ